MMENFFIESLMFEHETLCEIDSIFIEFAEGSIIENGQYLIEEASSKSQNLFTKLLNMIKSMLSKIKKFFSGESNEKKDEAVNRMEQAIENSPELKSKTKKVIDPHKVMKLSKEDLKKGAKSVVPCLVSMSIPTAILIYKEKTHKTEAQKLEKKINDLKKTIEEKNKNIHEIISNANEKINSVNDIIRERNTIAQKHNDMLNKYNGMVRDRNDIAHKHNAILNRYNDQKKVINDNQITINQQNAKINQLEQQNNNLMASMANKSNDNKELREKLAKNKKELDELTEELNVSNQQLQLLIKSQQQVEEIATGKTVDSEKTKTYNEKNILSVLHQIYINVIGVYKKCNKTVDINKIYSDIEKLFNSNQITLSGIQDKDVENSIDKKQIFGLYRKIQSDVEYIKKENISNAELKVLINKCKNRESFSDTHSKKNK